MESGGGNIVNTLPKAKCFGERNYHRSHKLYVDHIDKEETDANLAISNLIDNILILVSHKDPLVNIIKSPNLLIRGLRELQSMVEMVDIKCSIVSQIKFLITNQARKTSTINISSNSRQTDNSKFEGHMLHSVISGNPGTGKTTSAMILAKIWMALGFVNKKEVTDPQTLMPSPLILTNPVIDSYNRRIAELEKININNNRRIDQLKQLLGECHITSGEIRRQVVKLRLNTLEKGSEIIHVEKEWDQLSNHIRTLKSNFDVLIREVNNKDPNVYIDSNDIVSSELGDIPPITISISDNEAEDPYENLDPKFIVADRGDLIAEFQGQTVPKTKKVLESARGGVLFIDEAYSICNMDGGSKDKYGEECLTTINEFMSLYPNEIIIIFAGYKDKLMDSIFKAQEGLIRRIAYFFEIKDYTDRGLAKIFNQQLAKNSWVLDPDVNIHRYLSDNKDIVKSGGGGFTEKLTFYVKLAYGSDKFEETVRSTPDNPVVHNSIITDAMMKTAFSALRENMNDMVKVNNPPPGMYT